jgi:hypothetical protein
MNAEVDEAAEERKGGSGHLGKMLLSAGNTKMACLCHVPKALQEATAGFSIKEWAEAVAKAGSAEVGARLFARARGWPLVIHHQVLCVIQGVVRIWVGQQHPQEFDTVVGTVVRGGKRSFWVVRFVIL